MNNRTDQRIIWFSLFATLTVSLFFLVLTCIYQDPISFGSFASTGALSVFWMARL